MDIGKALIQLRKSRGWSQKELAAELNITQKMVSDYETHKRVPPVERLPDFAKMFGVSIDKLLGVKPLIIEREVRHVHKNSRRAKINDLLDKLTPVEERAILNHIRGLIAQRNSGKD
jgi:transcriptional regulator with XRE-family HTH domain